MRVAFADRFSEANRCVFDHIRPGIGGSDFDDAIKLFFGFLS
jgi:hypothetical protein